jgi:hypothetical protein
MQTLKNLILALTFLIGAALVIGALSLCFLHLIIG